MAARCFVVCTWPDGFTMYRDGATNTWFDSPRRAYVHRTISEADHAMARATKPNSEGYPASAGTLGVMLESIAVQRPTIAVLRAVREAVGGHPRIQELGAAAVQDEEAVTAAAVSVALQVRDEPAPQSLDNLKWMIAAEIAVRWPREGE